MRAYNKFQELIKMSLLQLLQQNTANSQMILHHFMAQRALEQQRLLQALAIALSKSTTSYQLAPNAHPLFQISIPVTAVPNTSPTTPKAVIEIFSESEDLPVRIGLQLNLKSQPCRAQAKNSTPIKQEYKSSPKTQELNPTSAENLPEQTHRKNKTKTIKKLKQLKQTDYYQALLPDLDELDACYTPKLGMRRNELAKRRQGLLERQVEMWGCALRKEKRQLRMLSF